MRKLDTVLVVDGSPVARELLARLMRPHARATCAIDDCEKAREWIAGNADLSLVVADLDAPGGGAMRLLEFTAGMSRAAPRVIVTGRHIGDAQRVQAELLGAIACVTKPICFREISRAIWASGGASGSSGHDAATRLHAAYPAKAHLLDASGRESHIVWNVHDLSASGALLDTRGPLPMHTEMSLALAFDDERIPLQCKVVRIQEPDWYTLPGVAVHFTEISPASRARLESYIRRRSGPS